MRSECSAALRVLPKLECGHERGDCCRSTDDRGVPKGGERVGESDERSSGGHARKDLVSVALIRTPGRTRSHQVAPVQLANS